MKQLLIWVLLFTSMASYAQLSIEDARVRAMPPGQPNTAAFMTVHNAFDYDLTFIKVSSQAAKKTEFHQHSMSANGVMSMHQVPSITIKAGECFEFKSGDYHIMLMGLTQPLQPGESIALTLHDTQNQQHTFMIPVVSLLKNTPQDHSHH